MRDGFTSGTRAASLTRPMRRPLRSSTGIPVNSVKNRRLSAIETSPRQTVRARVRTTSENGCCECALHGYLTPFPIWRIGGRSRKEKVDHGLQRGGAEGSGANAERYRI